MISNVNVISINISTSLSPTPSLHSRTSSHHPSECITPLSTEESLNNYNLRHKNSQSCLISFQ